MTAKQKIFVADQGWSWFVLFASFTSNVVLEGVVMSFALFYVDFLKEFHAGYALTSAFISILLGLCCAVGPIASVLANKFGCRLVTMAGALCASAGFFLCTFSPNVGIMILTYGVMGGIGFGFMYLCAYVMIGYYFEKYRALAVGISSCGSGVGTFIFAQLSVFLIETYSWKGAMWILSGLVLNGVVMGAIYRPPPKHNVESNGNDTDDAPLMDWKLLISPTFILLCLNGFTCLLGFFVPFVYLPDFARHIGLSREQGAILLSIIGITNTAGRLICGFLTDRPWMNALWLFNGSLIIAGTITILCPFINNFPLLCTYAAIFGLCIAAYISLTTIVLIEFQGLDRLSNSFGFLNLFRGIATFIGAPFAGFLFDIRGEYDLAFYCAGAVILFAGLICVPIRYIHNCTKGLCSESIGKTTVETGLPKDLVNDKALYSSNLSMTGSNLSFVAPNPYINKSVIQAERSKLTHSDHQVNVTNDIRENVLYCKLSTNHS